MIEEIMDAVTKEAMALLTDTGGTVILKTNYKSTKLETYTMPLLLVDIPGADETGQYLGGATHSDWIFAFNSYNYQPDSYGDDTSGYSASLLKVITTIRQHFSKGEWLSPGMPYIEDVLNFRFTLSGITPADALDQDGLIMGYKIVFDSIAIDNSTNFTQMSKAVLEHAVQKGYPPTT
jgi:hypothetical protein